jgi:hypothetical protein
MLRPMQPRALVCSTILASSALIPLTAFSQTPATFSAHAIYNSSDLLETVAHGDFNGDGREDFIVSDFVSGAPLKTLLFLSSGDGIYAAPITLAQVVSPDTLSVGDFNHDGKLDLVGAGSTGSGLAVYLGNGDGTFQVPRVVADSTYSSETFGGVIAADMNHDNKTDIVEVITVPGNYTLQTWISNGDGTFTAGQRITSNVLIGGAPVLGDYDGDGKPDVALVYSNQGQTTVQTWFGDGSGNLTSPITFNDPDNLEDTFSAKFSYENGSGHSVLLGGRFSYFIGGPATYQPQISMLTVNANRTYAFSTVATTNCPESVSMADFNGDGVNDLIFSEFPCSSGGGGVAPYTIVAKYGSSGGTYGAEQTVFNNGFYVSSLDVLKSTQGTRPDVFFNYWTGAQPNSGAAAAPQAIGLLNNDTTTGSFPVCGTANLVEGVNVCAPASTSATSPVNFSVSSAGPAPMRTAAVWVDGSKVAEQLTHAFSRYSFLDQSLTLAAGTHSVTVFGTAVDGTLQQKTFSLTVGGSGGSCAAPASPGVNICTPANGAYVGSPTQVTAAANIVGTLARMEVWVDYTKLYTETTSTSLNTSLSLAAGFHRFDVFAVNTAGTKYQTTTYATIGDGTCAADTGYDVHVCSPLASSIDSSPVRALATAHIVGTLARMEVWVDYVKQYTETNSLTLNTSLPLASGQHRFDFFAVNTAGTKYQTTVTATVP